MSHYKRNLHKLSKLQYNGHDEYTFEVTAFKNNLILLGAAENITTTERKYKNIHFLTFWPFI